MGSRVGDQKSKSWVRELGGQKSKSPMSYFAHLER